MELVKLIIKLIPSFLLLLTVSCTGLQPAQKQVDTALQPVTVLDDGSLLAQHAPVFMLEAADKSYNRIGTPTITIADNGAIEAYVDPQRPTIYTMTQKFVTNGGAYTNLIYRIHFNRTPFNHLTAGKNVGLLVIITLNSENQPVLLSTLHTCGCYLAMIPTANLSSSSYPQNWTINGQDVFGERLPSLLKNNPHDTAQGKFVLHIRSETHRVMHVERLTVNDISLQPGFVAAPLKPMAALRKLPVGDSEVSFFETAGGRKGYVRNSQKPYERLLMSWWAMDWRVGEDKDLGPSEETGTIFYTSLKFWDWKRSDLWNFAEFLEYWGWEL